jgi:hypothetical protein
MVSNILLFTHNKTANQKSVTVSISSYKTLEKCNTKMLLTKTKAKGSQALKRKILNLLQNNYLNLIAEYISHLIIWDVKLMKVTVMYIIKYNHIKEYIGQYKQHTEMISMEKDNISEHSSHSFIQK